MYEYDICYVSLCVGDRLVCRLGRKKGVPSKPAYQAVAYIRCGIDTVDSPDDEHMAARNMWRIEINI